MQTYLDYYADGLATKLARTYRVAAQDPSISKPQLATLKEAISSDGMALKYVSLHALAMISDPKIQTKLDTMSESEIETLCFQSRLFPFLDAKAEKKPLALQLSRQTIRALAGAGTTNEIRDLGRQIVSDHGLVYVDLPTNDFVLNERFALRAILVDVEGVRFKVGVDPEIEDDHDGIHFKQMDHDGTPVFTAVFYDTKNRAYPRLVWNEGDSYFSGRALNEPGGLFQPYPVKSIMKEADAETKDVMDDLENLFWLSLVFMQTEEEYGGVQFQQLPQLAFDHVRRQGRKAAQVAKKFSLFRVKKLTGGDNLGREPAERGESGSSGLSGIGMRRHIVRGHYRQQAYGKGHLKRRLRWIGPFERGSLETIPINDLRKITATNLQTVQL